LVTSSYSRSMHPAARVIKPQDKTLVRNNWQMCLFSVLFDWRELAKRSFFLAIHFLRRFCQIASCSDYFELRNNISY
jgi:hypothetical protein